VDKNKNDRIDSEKLAHLLRTNFIPPSYVYPSHQRPLRALLRQRTFFVWQRADLLARIQSHQLAHNRPAIRQSRPNRDPWEEKLLAHEDHPLRQLALKNELAMIRHFDSQITALEEQLHRFTKESLPREYALLQTVPGIGEHLGMTILYEIYRVLRGRRHRALPYRQGLSVLLSPGQRHRRQRWQDQGPARRQTGQPVPPLGFWRSGRHCQA
jgi:transposase